MNISGFLSSDFLSAGRASVVTRNVGAFHFDVVTAEGHDSTLRITENPIESGALIADHAVLEPKEITITGVMVGYTPPDYASSIFGVDTSIINRLPLPMNVRAITNQAISMASRYISVAESVAESSSRILAPFLPDYLGFADDSSAALDRVGKAYSELLNIQKSGEMIEVQTGIKLYENMMIRNIGVNQTTDGAAQFSLTIREIFIVESQIAEGIKIKTAPKTTQMGRTQPKDESSSFLNDSVDAGKKMVEKIFGGS